MTLDTDKFIVPSGAAANGKQAMQSSTLGPADVATAAQGALADSAVQPNDPINPPSVGATTPGSGAFTSLSATLTATFDSGIDCNNAGIANAGAISGVTTLTASGTITYDGTGAAGLTLRRDTTEGAGVGIRFEHVNDASQAFLAAAAFSVMRDETDGTEDGSFLIQAVTNGSVGDVADFDGTTGITLGDGLGINIGGVDLYAEEVTIADDAVATLNPPRNGGFVEIVVGGGGPTPSIDYSQKCWFDIGTSRRADKTLTGTAGSLLDTSTSTLTGTTGTDGNVTLSAASGGLELENRAGAALTFQIKY